MLLTLAHTVNDGIPRGSDAGAGGGVSIRRLLIKVGLSLLFLLTV